MAVLSKFTKQPGEVKDYNFSFARELAAVNDTIQSHSVTAEDGLTVVSTAVSSGVVKAFLSGGTTGTSYKVTCVVVTNGGRNYEAEIALRIKES